MKYQHLILLTLLAATLSACGDYWESGGDPLPARTMRLPRRVLNLMVGDRYHIPVAFNPDELPNEGVWWMSDDTSIARFENDSVIGVSEGQTVVYATSAVDRLTDSCTVNVLPEAYLNPHNYPYDMVVYADVTIMGHHYTQEDEDSLIITAVIGDELRGIGKMREWRGVPYMEIRIWHDVIEDIEPVTLRCYWRGGGRVQDFDYFLQFDGMAHGSLSNLIHLEIDELYDDDDDTTIDIEVTE